MPTFRSHVVVLALLAVQTLSGSIASATQSVDPFYERLYAEGVQLRAAGQAEAAASKLRFACFGMLEFKERLATCLAHLLTAQAAADIDAEHLGRTVDRILELEGRFGTWSRVPLDERLRAEAEQVIGSHASMAALRAIPTLRRAAIAREAEELRELPADERHRRLDGLISRDPQEPTWHVLQVETAYEREALASAARAATETLNNVSNLTAGQRSSVACVRGLADQGRGACRDRTVDDLAACDGEPRYREAGQEALLHCLVEGRRWTAAEQLLDRMSPSLRDKRSVKKLAKSVERRRGSARRDDPAGRDAEESARRPDRGADSVADISPSPAGGAAGLGAVDPGLLPDPLPDAARSRVEANWAVLREHRREAYREVWKEVRRLSIRYPESPAVQRLAGEVAFRLGQWRDAVRHFRRNEYVLIGHPQQRLHLAMALYYGGDTAAARRAMAEDRASLDRLGAAAWVDYWDRRLRSAG